jgi:hypothetical protein
MVFVTKIAILDEASVARIFFFANSMKSGRHVALRGQLPRTLTSVFPPWGIKPHTISPLVF